MVEGDVRIDVISYNSKKKGSDSLHEEKGVLAVLVALKWYMQL